MTKRIFCMLLTLVLLFGLIPAPAQAAESTPETAVDTGAVTVEGTNSFGTLLSADIAEQQAQQEADSTAGYTVTDLVIEGSTATVTYDSLEEATVVVALYSEDGRQLLNTGKATVLPEQTEVSLTIEGTMPDYFLASAYLLDSYDLSPLCPAYDTPMYTQEMQELLASTVADYDADRVLNLDDSEETNFAVYADTTKVIEWVDGVNTVTSADTANATYVIKNADSQITGLESGDIFAYPYSDNEILIVKVDTLTLSGTTATITGAELEMEEAFALVKIEGQMATDGAEIDTSTTDEGITYLGKSTDGPVTYAFEGELSRETAAEFEYNIFEKGVFSFSGNVDFKSKVSFEYYISLSYQRVEFSVDLGAEIGFNVSVEASSKDVKVKLGTLRFPVVPGVSVTFTPTLVAKLSVSISGSLEFSTTIGFGFNHNKSGWNFLNLCSTPKASLDAELKGELFIGFNLTPAAKVLDGTLADAKISGELGFTITGEVLEVSTDGFDDKIHDCVGCIDGNVALGLKVSPSLKLLKSKKLEFSTQLVNVNWDLFDFYVCLQHLKAGLGNCPNIKYRVVVSVVDDEGNPISGASVAVNATGTLGQTDGKGIISTYLHKADYTITATNSDGTAEKLVNVIDACSVTIVIGEEEKQDYFESIDSDDLASMIDNGTASQDWYGNHQYIVIDASMTWTAAQAYCESIGGHLATITSAEEQAFVLSLLSGASQNMYWIGARKVGNWAWVTGESFSYSNWGPNEPNNEEGEEAYVQMYAKAFRQKVAGDWNDATNSGAAYSGDFYSLEYTGFICEFESSSTYSLREEANGDSVTVEMPHENAVFGGEYSTEATEAYNLKTAAFSDLVPGAEYVLLALVSIDVDDPLAADNVLYIDQAVTGEDGTLSFQYVQRVDTGVSYVMACGASNKNLADATITFPTMKPSDEVQLVRPTVTYDGQTLVEGRDYVVLGDVAFTGAGQYTCYIRGIYSYAGLVECKYNVKNTPLKILTQPVSVTASDGDQAKVTFKAQGEGLKYQWYYAGAGSSSFKLTTAFSTNAYYVAMNESRAGRRVYCVVTDQYGDSVRTKTVTLNRGTTLKITSQPADVKVLSGQSAKVTLKATGDGLTYRWYYANKGDTAFKLTTAFTGASYNVAMNDSRDGRRVYCVVTDQYGSSVTSNTVTLRQGTPAAILTQPVSVTVSDGVQARVTVKAQGDGLTYRWYYAAPGAKNFTLTKSFTTNSYYVTMNQARAGRRVYCVITDQYGNTVTTNTVTLSRGTTLKITKQPADVKVLSGQSAKVTLKAQGDGLTYQWYYANKSDTTFKLTTAFTGASYNVAMNDSRDGRRVYCVVTDRYGSSVTTDVVTLKMGTAAKITAQPVSVSVAEGKTARVTVTAIGDGLTYTWYYANAGSTTFTKTTAFTTNQYYVAMNESRDGRRVYCVITDRYGNSVKTNVVTISMK